MTSRFMLPPFSTVKPRFIRLLARARVGCVAVLAFLLFVGFARAQTVPAAHQGVAGRLEVGAGFSGFNTDAEAHPFEYGIAAFADVKVWRSLGIEAEGRTIQFNETTNIRQDTAMGGFRYLLPWRRVVSPYAKALAGIGSADFPLGTYRGLPREHDTFSAVEIGGGAEYRLSPKFSLRGEFDYQIWRDYGRGSKGGLGLLNPGGFTVGVAYHIL